MKEYLLATDFQTLSFNHSGHVLSELPGIRTDAPLTTREPAEVTG